MEILILRLVTYMTSRVEFKLQRRTIFATLSIVGIFLVSSAPGFFVGAFAASVSFTAPINLSNDAAKAVNPDVFNVGSHVYVVWSEGGMGVKFRESPDGGVTWNPPISSPALKLSTRGVINGPLVSANGSNVYVVWNAAVNKVSQVFFAQSTNYGVTFSKAQQLTSGNSGADTAVVASWGSVVYVAYDNVSSTRDYVLSSTSAGAVGTWTKPFLYSLYHEPQLAAWGTNGYAVGNQGLSVTHNNGATWQNKTVPGGNTSGLPPTMSETWVAAAGTNVYAFYETKGDSCTGCSQVNYTLSRNSGNTWSRENTLSKTLKNAWAPMVAAFGNTVWVAFHTNPGGANSQMYITRSTNTGTTWSSPVSLSGLSGDTSFPFTVVTSDGTNVFVGWSQQSNPSTWIFRVAYSGDGGSTWTPAPGINVSQNPAGTQAATNQDLARGAITSFGTHCYVAYQFTSGTTNQIYFASS